MAEAYIIDAVRTPRGIGKYGKGALHEIHPQRLGSQVLPVGRGIGHRPPRRQTLPSAAGMRSRWLANTSTSSVVMCGK